MDGNGIDVPSYFVCPISLQIMRDPVTLSTGITYDRDNIERWIFTGKNDTCPLTKQLLTDVDLTPNHTLRRLIQEWCTANASNGVEQIPTPRPPVEMTQISKLLDGAGVAQSQMKSLRRLRSIVAASERNRRCAESAGAPDLLVSFIKNNPSASNEELNGNSVKSTTAADEAVNILYTLQISDQGIGELVTRNGDLIESLTAMLQRSSNYQSRAYATFLLQSIFESVDLARPMSLRQQLFVEIVRVLRDRVSYKAMKAALHIIVKLCPWGRNRIKAVDAGCVAVLIELLLDEPEKRMCEMMLVVLDQLCLCAEGRAKFLEHRAGIAMVSKKILRVSILASDRALRILFSVSKFSATPSVLQEMLQLGVVSKFCLVLHTDCLVKTKEKAKEILRLHSRAWRNSPCISPLLQASYPSLLL